MEIDGGMAIETLTCETVFSPTYEAHRYELTDPWTARWVWTKEMSW